MNKTGDRIRQFFIFLVLVGFAVAILTGYKRFVLWEQITEVLNQNVDADLFVSLFEDFQAHSLRLALMFPVVLLAEFIEVDQDIVFSFFVLTALWASYITTTNTLKLVAIHRGYALIFIAIMSLAVMMNGRLSFAILGNTLILYALEKREIMKKMAVLPYVTTLLAALWLSSVSSGTFMVGVFQILLFYSFSFLFMLKSNQSLSRFAISVVFTTFILIFLAPVIELYIEKNISYFYSFEEILGHGFLRHFESDIAYLLPLIVLGFVVLLCLLHYRARLYRFYLPPVSLVVSASCVGVLGDSSFLSGIMGFILLAVFEFTMHATNARYHRTAPRPMQVRVSKST